MSYAPRKRFRSDQHAARAERTAARVRRHRLYEAAVRAGHPVAVEADLERARSLNPMGPANALHELLAELPREERLRRRDEFLAVQARCAAVDRGAARKRYLELRARVIAEAEAFT